MQHSLHCAVFPVRIVNIARDDDAGAGHLAQLLVRSVHGYRALNLRERLDLYEVPLSEESLESLDGDSGIIPSNSIRALRLGDTLASQ